MLARVRQRDRHRVAGDRRCVLAERARPARARARAPAAARPDRVAVVADVVDAAGERVHGAHRLALEARQQPDAVVEVRGLAARDLLALAVGVLDLDRRDGHRPAAVLSSRVANASGRDGRRPATSSSASSAPPAAGDEARDRQPRRGRQRAGQRRAAAEQRPRARRLERDQRPQLRGRRPEARSCLAAAEALQVLPRHVDAAAA